MFSKTGCLLDPPCITQSFPLTFQSLLLSSCCFFESMSHFGLFFLLLFQSLLFKPTSHLCCLYLTTPYFCCLCQLSSTRGFRLCLMLTMSLFLFSISKLP